jgi:hypothetical protein
MKNGQSQESGSFRRAPLECPECFSNCAEILNTRPLKARCVDCDAVYPIHTVTPITEQGDDNEFVPDGYEQEKPAPRQRKTKADIRAEIKPVPPPDPKYLGVNTELIEEVLAAGPTGLKKAEHATQRIAKRFGEQFEKRWTLETDYVRSLKICNRARARWCMRWRPIFLACLALSRSMLFAAKKAEVAYNTPAYHRLLDRQFDEQCCAAEAYAVELLHQRVWQRALEGDLEPVHYMGVVVGYIKKFSDKLQIELLRAYMPDKFKTPGQSPAVSINAGRDILVLSEEQRARLIAANRARVLTMPTTRAEEDKRLAAREQGARPLWPPSAPST